jgi:hypothetical protein
MREGALGAPFFAPMPARASLPVPKGPVPVPAALSVPIATCPHCDAPIASPLAAMTTPAATKPAVVAMTPMAPGSVGGDTQVG